jgi:tetratricopeptide (TPR) repeat protein
MIQALLNLGLLSADQGDYAAAIRYAKEGLTLAREIGDRYWIAWCLSLLGRCTGILGDIRAAWRYLREALAEAQKLSAPPLTLMVLATIAELQAKGDASLARRAAELLGLALGHLACNGDVIHAAKPARAALRAALPADELEAAMQRGKSLDLDTVVQELLAEPAPGSD